MGTAKVKVFAIKQPELEELIIKAAKAGADTAIDKFKELKQKRTDEAEKELVKNIRIALGTYRRLKSDLLCSDYSSDEAQTELRFKAIEDLMEPGDPDTEYLLEREIRRLKENAWTKRQIDRALALLKEDCTRTGNPDDMRKYDIIMKLYINDEVMELADIAESEFVTDRTVYRLSAEACRMMIPYLFNIDKILGICQGFSCEK